MAKNINIATVNSDAFKAIATYYKTVMTERELRKTAKAAVDKAAENLETCKQSAAALIAGGASVEEASSTFNTANFSGALANAQEAYNTLCADIRTKKATATNLVPDALFEAYTKRKEDRDAFINAIRDFLLGLGLTGTDRGVERLGEGMALHITGSGKATGKSAKSGHLLKDWTKTTFKDMTIRAFIEYALFDKGVFEKDEDYNLTIKTFEDEEA